ncbi:hypothetical protein ACTXT7_013135 [Hymenolepis weldensis]
MASVGISHVTFTSQTTSQEVHKLRQGGKRLLCCLCLAFKHKYRFSLESDNLYTFHKPDLVYGFVFKIYDSKTTIIIVPECLADERLGVKIRFISTLELISSQV